MPCSNPCWYLKSPFLPSPFRWLKKSCRMGERTASIKEHRQSRRVTDAAGLLRACPNRNPFLASFQTSPPLRPEGMFVFDPESDIQRKEFYEDSERSRFAVELCRMFKVRHRRLSRLSALLPAKDTAIGASSHILTTFKIQTDNERNSR